MEGRERGSTKIPSSLLLAYAPGIQVVNRYLFMYHVNCTIDK